MLADLDPKPDQVTIAINTSQMNIVELMTDSDIAGTSFERPELWEAYRNMEVPAGPEWVEEHLKRLTANGIQPHFQLAHSAQLETVERLVRRLGHRTSMRRSIHVVTPTPRTATTIGTTMPTVSDEASRGGAWSPRSASTDRA